MEREIYTPMEKILIEGAQKLTTKETCDNAKKTSEQAITALELDLMLLEMEKHFNQMDGIELKEWLL